MVPAISSRRLISTRAGAGSIAVCPSWPQACIVPLVCERYSTALFSSIGRASMSPRSRNTLPDRSPLMIVLGLVRQ